MKSLHYLIIWFLLISACQKPIDPPHAMEIPDTIRVHGFELIDNYSWLKDKSRSQLEVLEHLKAENEYTRKILLSHQKLQKQLFAEMKGRLEDEDVSVPVKRDEYFYYQRREKNKQYPLYCRRKGDLSAPEEIYLDINPLAAKHDFYSIYSVIVSPDHRYAAFSVDTTGTETYHLRILDLQNNEYLTDSQSSISDLVWSNDSKIIFYTLEDETGRTHEAYRHDLYSNPQNDRLIFAEPDEKFWLSLEKSRDQRFIILSSDSKTTSEVYYLSADNISEPFTLIETRQQGIQYYPLFNDSKIFFITNWNAPNKKIMLTSADEMSKKYWRDFLPHRDSIKISVEIFLDHLVITEKNKGIDHLRIIDLNSGESHYLDFVEPVYSFYPWSSTEFDSPFLYFSYESLQTPYTVYKYDMKTKQRTQLKQQKIDADFRPDDYQTERLEAIARDGSRIPISLCYRKDLFKKDGSSPLLLTAYGAYGDSYDPYFSTSRLSLLNRGISYAIAHVRGGSELGELWYEQGKMLNKKNTFYDFIDCSRYLIENSYTASENLIINGGSAGGLLIGVVLNLQPQLFRAAVADVPFVDLINTMLDPSLSAVISEYEEWGDPADKNEFEYMLSYSPYENIRAQSYPSILAVAGFYDSRVNYWEAAKWTARLRAAKIDSNLLLLYTNMKAGHGGASGRYDYLEEVALIYTFILKSLDK